MSDNNFIDARGFTFKPFPHPLRTDGEVGDSGALEFATSKTDPNEQYIIKCSKDYPELGCNEFMYHKVAAALGLYTQEVKLIKGSKDYRRSAAIRYVPNIQLFDIDTSNEENLRAVFEFEALFVIINEDDTHEYYLDEQGKIFKLDNAASFRVFPTTVFYFDGKLPDYPSASIAHLINNVEYSWYNLKYDHYKEKHGQIAAEAYISMFRKFSELDEETLYEAYNALEKQYPRSLCLFYSAFIKARKKSCRKFFEEIMEGVTA